MLILNFSSRLHDLLLQIHPGGWYTFSRNVSFIQSLKVVHFAPELVVHFTPESLVHFAPELVVQYGPDYTTAME